MALLTQTLVKARVRVTFAAPDNNGVIVERSKIYELEMHGADDATKITNAFDDVASFLTDLANMTEADVASHEVAFVYDTSDALTGTVTHLYHELLLTLIPDTLGAGDISHNIPAPADAILANGVALNPTAPVLAYLDNFEPAAGGNYMRLSRGQAITAAAGQVRTSRVKTKSSRKSYG